MQSAGRCSAEPRRSCWGSRQRRSDRILTDLIAWLEANAPATDRVTLVHGAYRTGNLLIHEDRISAVLDWELQVLGDPMYDVADVLSDLNREGTPLLSNLVEREAFYRDYEAATGCGSQGGPLTARTWRSRWPSR
jgi:aminoglycoside phosphotransferase (APT) family kinase protein